MPGSRLRKTNRANLYPKRYEQQRYYGLFLYRKSRNIFVFCRGDICSLSFVTAMRCVCHRGEEGCHGVHRHHQPAHPARQCNHRAKHPGQLPGKVGAVTKPANQKNPAHLEALHDSRVKAEVAINEITDKADVGFGFFYNHFESKEAIYIVLIDKCFEEFADALEEFIASLEDPAEIIAALIRHTVRRAADDPVWGRFCFAKDCQQMR